MLFSEIAYTDKVIFSYIQFVYFNRQSMTIKVNNWHSPCNFIMKGCSTFHKKNLSNSKFFVGAHKKWYEHRKKELWNLSFLSRNNYLEIFRFYHSYDFIEHFLGFLQEVFKRVEKFQQRYSRNKLPKAKYHTVNIHPPIFQRDVTTYCTNRTHPLHR